MDGWYVADLEGGGLTLVQLLAIILIVTSSVNIFRFIRAPRRGSRYNTMVLLVMWMIVGVYVISK